MQKKIQKRNYKNENETYCVYVHKNKINGKAYVGQTICSKNLMQRWGTKGQGYNRCSSFSKAIKKYGWENFEHIILEDDILVEDVDNKEVYWIQQFRSNEKAFGYNETLGGKRNTLKTSRAVYKLDVNKNILGEYESTRSAARLNGQTSHSGILRSCKSGYNRAIDLYWCYVDEYAQYTITPYDNIKKPERKVYMMDEHKNILETYASPTKAYKALNKTVSGHIVKSCKTGKVAYGRWWCYADEYDEYCVVTREQLKQIENKGKPVIKIKLGCG